MRQGHADLARSGVLREIVDVAPGPLDVTVGEDNRHVLAFQASIHVGLCPSTNSGGAGDGSCSRLAAVTQTGPQSL